MVNACSIQLTARSLPPRNVTFTGKSDWSASHYPWYERGGGTSRCRR